MIFFVISNLFAILVPFFVHILGNWIENSGYVFPLVMAEICHSGYDDIFFGSFCLSNHDRPKCLIEKNGSNLKEKL